MDNNELLRSLGFSYKEAEVYLAALSLGPTSVLAISRKTLIHRTIIYQILEELIQKGLFTTTLVGKRKTYLAVNPKELLLLLKNRENQLKDALPELLAISNIGKEKPHITYYEGKEQLRQLFRTGLECHSKLMYSYYPSKYMSEIFGKKEMEEIIQARIDRKIYGKTLRSLETDEPFSGSNQTEEALREIRYLPKGMDPRMGMVIFDDTVNLFSPINENFGIQIQSKAYSEFMHCMFQSLWDQSIEVATI